MLSNQKKEDSILDDAKRLLNWEFDQIVKDSDIKLKLMCKLNHLQILFMGITLFYNYCDLNFSIWFDQ